MTPETCGRTGRRARRAPTFACMLVLVLAGCGAHNAADSSQVVASVNGDEITETEVNATLERQGQLQPGQIDAEAHRVVSGLVGQAVVVQKAHDLKIDRDERVMQNIEAMKRQLIAAAYLERIADGASKPTAKETQDWYDHNPVLFTQRRVFAFEELAIDAPPEKSHEIQARLGALKTFAEMNAYLQANQIAARSTQTTLTPENLPPAMLQRVATLAPGQGLIVPNTTGMRVLVLQSSQDAPLTFEQARSAITAYLAAQNRRQAVQKELDALRADAKVAYFGKFADLGASAPQAAASVATVRANVDTAAASASASPVTR